MKNDRQLAWAKARGIPQDLDLKVDSVITLNQLLEARGCKYAVPQSYATYE